MDRLVQPMILTIVAQGTLHGYKIVERMTEMPIFAGKRPDVTGVYRSLKAMEGRGLVVSTWNASRVGPAKRLYKLTKAGRACLAYWVSSLEVYRREVGQFIVLGKCALAREARTRAATCWERRRTGVRSHGKRAKQKA